MEKRHFVCTDSVKYMNRGMESKFMLAFAQFYEEITQPLRKNLVGKCILNKSVFYLTLLCFLDHLRLLTYFLFIYIDIYFSIDQLASYLLLILLQHVGLCTEIFIEAKAAATNDTNASCKCLPRHFSADFYRQTHNLTSYLLSNKFIYLYIFLFLIYFFIFQIIITRSGQLLAEFIYQVLNSKIFQILNPYFL